MFQTNMVIIIGIGYNSVNTGLYIYKVNSGRARIGRLPTVDFSSWAGPLWNCARPPKPSPS